jgi:DNA polymerase III epsilon subunit-like protein
MQARFFIGDTETVGVSVPKEHAGASGVCDVAFLEIDLDLNVLGQEDTLINPGCPIHPQASEVHGITDEMVAQAPTLQQWLGPDLSTEPVVLIAHNAQFDKRFLSPWMNIVGTICTLQMARKLLPDVENHKLGTLAQHLGVEAGTAHRAMGDVQTLHGVFKHLVALSDADLPTLVARAQEPSIIHTMPFGKHKGKPLMKLPRDYINYMLGLELSPDLRHSLNHALKCKI